MEKFDGDILKYHTFKRKFKSCIEEAYQDYNVRMSFLEESCIGKAFEIISGLSCFDDRKHAYQLAWERLDRRFGNQTKLMSQIKKDLLEGNQIKEWDADGLLNLCDLMYKCETSFKAWGEAGLLNSDDIMQGLFQRLPYRVRAKFVSLNNQGEDSGTFEELRELIESAASEADSSYGKLMQQKKSQKLGFQATGRSKSVCAAVQQSKNKSSWSGSEVQQLKNKSCGSGSEVQVCVVCKGKHDLKSCPTFLSKSVQERKQVVREGRLCFNCLCKGHRIAECRSKLTCHECGRKHNTLLHFQANESADRQEKFPSTSESSESGNQPAESVLSASTSSKRGNRTVGQTIFKVVPVKLWFSDPSKYEYTYAFIDEGSSVNLCAAGLAKRLGIPISHGHIIQLLLSIRRFMILLSKV